ncbi:MAG: winged helix-turn-helix domain-containing protein [Sandaracinobacteroides sp.]
MRIDLAGEPDFELGAMRVAPATREVFAPSGREVLEPRVMMVLVALGHARGQVVSRDALIARCWDGLAVGDDAINRVIGRLRKLASATGAFRIETITKVGYRLEAVAAATGPEALPKADFYGSKQSGWRKGRWPLAAGLLLTGLGAAILWQAWPAVRSQRAAETLADAPASAGSDPVADELIRQGRSATREHSPQRVEQGVAQLREATVRNPGSAQAWGALAAGYTALLNRLPFEEQPAVEMRARQAIRQALALDPEQPDALMAQSAMVPMFGNWRAREALERRAMAAAGSKGAAAGPHPRFLLSVGRPAQAIPAIEQALQRTPTGLMPRVTLAQALWTVGRIDEADRLIQESLRLFPRNYLPWFHNMYLLMYSGRAADAARFGAARGNWPDDIPEAELRLTGRMAQALASADPALADALIAEYRLLAPQGRGYTENAIRISAALGRPDEAFRFMEQLYLLPQDQLPRVRFKDQRNFGRPGERLTELLFVPPVDRLHGDPRFLQLMERMGLVAYWRASGIGPDLCRDHAAACKQAGIPPPALSAS